jgi:hypothetical protein
MRPRCNKKYKRGANASDEPAILGPVREKSGGRVLYVADGWPAGLHFAAKTLGAQGYVGRQGGGCICLAIPFLRIIEGFAALLWPRGEGIKPT